MEPRPYMDKVLAFASIELQRAGKDDAAADLLPCVSVGCLHVAQFETHWPGTSGHHCHHCTVRAVRVAEAMGFDLQHRYIGAVVDADSSSQRARLLELE